MQLKILEYLIHNKSIPLDKRKMRCMGRLEMLARLWAIYTSIKQCCRRGRVGECVAIYEGEEINNVSELISKIFPDKYNTSSLIEIPYYIIHNRNLIDINDINEFLLHSKLSIYR